jgi:hypothetical protein
MVKKPNKEEKRRCLGQFVRRAAGSNIGEHSAGSGWGIVGASVKLRQRRVNLRNGAVKMKVTTLRHAC